METAALLTGAAMIVAALVTAAVVWLLSARHAARERARLAALRADTEAREERLARTQETVDSLLATLRQREASVLDREKRVREREELADRQARDIAGQAEEQARRLEELAGLTAEQARREILDREQDEMGRHVRRMAADIEARARDNAESRARDVVCTAVQRLALSTVTPATTVSVALPEGDMKARIIGREGRNIRSFEERSGVNLVIDDVPDAVLLSSFEPKRREIARIALTALIQDGRIYPTTIEEHLARAERQVEVEAQRAASEAAMEVRVGDLHPELLAALGELHLRTSFGQNVLQHAVEVAHLAGLMAHELGVDVELARRAGLLHDLGKGLRHDEEGSHARVGADLAARFGESASVCHVIEAHHGEVEAMSPEAVLVQTADMISLSRPGGRREQLEQYMTRLRRIEEICLAFDGVERAHAMQSGRDIRVMVSPERVGDADTRELARRIAARVESEPGYLGRVAVTVVRELRATEIVQH